uniref:Uncharacterized protein n=1 Tax=Parascaris equorum TaxID=6256 RepID=A0A914RGG3_PAREQ
MLTFRETLADFIANCTFSQANRTERGCSLSRMQHWTGGLYGVTTGREEWSQAATH